MLHFKVFKKRIVENRENTGLKSIKGNRKREDVTVFRILLAEDEQQIRHLLQKVLEHEGYEVVGAKDGEQALELFFQESFDLVILDWMMPKCNGLEVAQAIKQELPMKILMLTAKHMPEDEVEALLSGVDDYLVKPFHATLLLVRVAKILDMLRTEKHDRFTFRAESHQVALDGEKIILTAKEFDLLYYFYTNRNLVLTRQQLLMAVWGMENENDERTVDSFVRILREKLGKDWIKTVYGLGYQFEIDEK